MTYGILLVYYEKYYIRAIEQFSKLISKVDKESKLIIVTNNNQLKEFTPIGKECTWIQGDNTNWDFSGWQEGINSIKEICDKDSIIFANDTFCFHNPWGRYEFESAKLVMKFLRLKNNLTSSNKMAGHRLFMENTYDVLGSTSRKWISTYLFYMSGEMLNTLNKKICLDERILDELISVDEKSKLEWGDVSGSLVSHIESWMFPNGDEIGWYNNISSDNEIKIRKIKTILNEKFLTAMCESNNGKVYDMDILRAIKNIRKH